MTNHHVRKVAIMTSGGDAPGMNAAIRAATTLLCSKGVEVLGIKYGYRGLLREKFIALEAEDVSTILRDGGTILGSARCPEFHQKETRDKARAILERHGIDGLMVIGGNGSLTGASLLSHPDELPEHQNLITVGLPASIDNDIGLTGQAIGVDTAINTIVEACDKIADTASAFDRTFVIEVMGRDSGYLAMTSAIASGADNVLFPETQSDEQTIINKVVKTVLQATNRDDRPKHTLIIKAEGTKLTSDELKKRVDAHLNKELGDDGPIIETRVTILGHVVRGGRPSAFDRLLASRLGHAGVDALLRGQNRTMVAWMLPWVPEEHIATRSPVDPYCWVVPMDEVLAETQRLLDGTSQLTQWRKSVFASIEDVLVL